MLQEEQKVSVCLCLPSTPRCYLQQRDASWEALAKLPNLGMEQRNLMFNHHPND